MSGGIGPTQAWLLWACLPAACVPKMTSFPAGAMSDTVCPTDEAGLCFLHCSTRWLMAVGLMSAVTARCCQSFIVGVQQLSCAFHWAWHAGRPRYVGFIDLLQCVCVQNPSKAIELLCSLPSGQAGGGMLAAAGHCCLPAGCSRGQPASQPATWRRCALSGSRIVCQAGCYNGYSSLRRHTAVACQAPCWQQPAVVTARHSLHTVLV